MLHTLFLFSCIGKLQLTILRYSTDFWRIANLPSLLGKIYTKHTAYAA